MYELLPGWQALCHYGPGLKAVSPLDTEIRLVTELRHSSSRISANYETEHVPCSPCPSTATGDNDDTEGDSQVLNQSPQPLSVDVVIGMEPEAQQTPNCEASPQSLKAQPHPTMGVVSSGLEIDALACLQRDDEFERTLANMYLLEFQKSYLL